MKTAQERIETTVNNIMSGDNACGTLANAAYNNDRDYFRRAVTPVVTTYEEEAQQLRSDRDGFSRQAEAYRQALEYVASNARASSLAHLEAYVSRALGRM